MWTPRRAPGRGCWREHRRPRRGIRRREAAARRWRPPLVACARKALRPATRSRPGRYHMPRRPTPTLRAWEALSQARWPALWRRRPPQPQPLRGSARAGRRPGAAALGGSEPHGHQPQLWPPREVTTAARPVPAERAARGWRRARWRAASSSEPSRGQRRCPRAEQAKSWRHRRLQQRRANARPGRRRPPQAWATARRRRQAGATWLAVAIHQRSARSSRPWPPPFRQLLLPSGCRNKSGVQ